MECTYSVGVYDGVQSGRKRDLMEMSVIIVFRILSSKTRKIGLVAHANRDVPDFGM